MPGSSHCCDCLAPTEVVWRWEGEGRVRWEGGGLQNKEGKAEEVKIEDGERKGDGAFVHLKENGKGKRLSSEGELATASAKCLE